MARLKTIPGTEKAKIPETIRYELTTACDVWLDIDTPGCQILERCNLLLNHFGDHESRTQTWNNKRTGAYDPFSSVPELKNFEG